MFVAILFTCIGVLHAEPFTIINEFPGGTEASFTVHADHAIHGWQVRLVFDRPIYQLKIWVADIVSHTPTEWVVRNKEYNRDVSPGNDVTVEFQYFYSGDQVPHGTYTIQGFELTGYGTTFASNTASSSMRYNYSEALGLSILFYDAQRSGKLPTDNPIPWRGDSALSDADNRHDLSGGWYDAGKHIKYNFPMAFSTWVLEWGMLKFADGYKTAGQVNMACDMIRWPLEYFLKSWIPEKNILYVQVGDPDFEDIYWGRAENMNMSRPAYKVTESCKGSDVAGDTVSAFAAGYLVFKHMCSDAVFADKLLTAAKSLYTFTVNNRGRYTDCLTKTKTAYGSSFENDEVALAAVWMYKATRDNTYLSYARGHYPGGTSWTFSWDDVNPAVALLLYEETRHSVYKRDIESFIRDFLPGGKRYYTPCGLVWVAEWGTSRYAANVALIALMAAEEGIQPDTYKKWALSQINYILGDNKLHISYMIGFGNAFPLHPHHKGSACPTNVDWCFENASGPNPNILYGGLVGGPDRKDNYSDKREDEKQNSATCDGNAAFQSALAGLVHLAVRDSLPRAPDSRC
ncbi:endoglucanase E-4-like isoform X2 [Mercenaria mercenaria]|uniref:endoglucanase E-4-like isoform X2 n=1 Tax=Mercenaria mercenaria TaxID=6596 RepID=UPI00234FAF44|nr:endoglucanase E-4-like isoform X2 [Mercenaria mercenaria]